MPLGAGEPPALPAAICLNDVMGPRVVSKQIIGWRICLTLLGSLIKIVPNSPPPAS